MKSFSQFISENPHFFDEERTAADPGARARNSRTAPEGAFGISDKGKDQAATNRMNYQIQKAGSVERYAAGKRSLPANPTTAPKPAAPKPQYSSDQQKVRAEYDRLRKTDPKAAVAYGLKMARSGASKSSFKYPGK